MVSGGSDVVGHGCWTCWFWSISVETGRRDEKLLKLGNCWQQHRGRVDTTPSFPWPEHSGYCVDSMDEPEET